MGQILYTFQSLCLDHFVPPKIILATRTTLHVTAEYFAKLQ